MPKSSSTETANVKPLSAVTALGGWAVTTRCVATPGAVIFSGLLVAGVKPAAAAWSV